MSQNAIFIIGAIIFGITVYGVVMAGGIALGRIEDDNPESNDTTP